MKQPYICKKCGKEMWSLIEVVEYWDDIYCKKCYHEKLGRKPDESLSNSSKELKPDLQEQLSKAKERLVDRSSKSVMDAKDKGVKESARRILKLIGGIAFIILVIIIYAYELNVSLSGFVMGVLGGAAWTYIFLVDKANTRLRMLEAEYEGKIEELKLKYGIEDEEDED